HLLDDFRPQHDIEDIVIPTRMPDYDLAILEPLKYLWMAARGDQIGDIRMWPCEALDYFCAIPQHAELRNNSAVQQKPYRAVDGDDISHEMLVRFLDRRAGANDRARPGERADVIIDWGEATIQSCIEILMHLFRCDATGHAQSKPHMRQEFSRRTCIADFVLCSRTYLHDYGVFGRGQYRLTSVTFAPPVPRPEADDDAVATRLAPASVQLAVPTVPSITTPVGPAEEASCNCPLVGAVEPVPVKSAERLIPRIATQP